MDNVKKFTRALHDSIENETMNSIKDYQELKEKYMLTSNDLSKIDEVALQNLEEAYNYYENGSWDRAVEKIRSASSKAPFNSDIIALYGKILIEDSNLSEDKNSNDNELKIILHRAKQSDKKVFRELKSSIKRDKPAIKFDKLWLITIFIPLLPIIIIFFIRNLTPKTPPPLPSPLTKTIINGEIPISIDKKPNKAELKIEIITSKLNSNNSSFNYNLEFLLSSEKENLLKIDGRIIWKDRQDRTIFYKEFTAGNDVEYFLNEKIPVTFRKSSLRTQPDLYETIIQIDNIITMPGKERPELDEINFELPENQFSKLKIYNALYSVTEGVVANYLTLTTIIENNNNYPITELIGDIVWFDEYNNESGRNRLEIVRRGDIPIASGEKRKIDKAIEVNGEMTSNYKIIIERLK